MGKSEYRRLASRASLLVSAAMLALGTPVMAQDARHNFDIPAQDAASALQEFARQAGKQVLFPYDAAAGRPAPAIQGNLSDGEVLNRLAAAAGLRVVSDDGRTVTLRAVGNGEDAAGDAQAESEIIVTAEGVSAMRVPTPLRSIPQSVSVISRETLDQQNARDLSDTLTYATGITVLRDDSLTSGFVSRGFEISEVHVDGSAPLVLDGNSNVVVPDMAQFEQVEVLRGADGLFGGFGNPGGTVNLERKKPGRAPSASIDLSAGSWNNYRAEADVTAPLALDGDLSARAVVVYENRDYFYDTAELERIKGYGILGYDLGASTTLRVGGSYETNDLVPVIYAIPHYDDGSDARLPRSTALIPPWNRSDTKSVELFGQFEHRFSPDWELKVNATRLRQTDNSKYAYVLGTINPVTNLISGPSTAGSESVSRNLLVDATLTGAFYLFGQRHEIIVGADHSHLSSDISADFFNSSEPRFNPFTTNLDDLVEPEDVFLGTVADFRRSQYGVMGALRLRPVEGLSIIGGGRTSFLKQHQNNQTYLFGDLLFEQELSTETKGKFVPYGGIVYDLSSEYSLYASYADIYRPASALLKADMTRLPATMDGVNIEAGIKAAWRGGALNGSLAFYKIDQRGGSVRDPGVNSPLPDCCYLPQTRRSKGFEAELSGRVAPGWHLTTGYTFNDNETVSEVSPEGVVFSSQTPRHLFKLWTNYKPSGALEGWELGGGIVAQSSSYVEGVGCPAFDQMGQCMPGVDPRTPFKLTQKAYAVVDLRVAYALTENWTAALTLNNLFDKRYYQNIGQGSSGLSDAWYGTPRNFLLKLSANY